MEILSLLLSLLSVLLNVFLALAVYFCLRYLVSLASTWHEQHGGKPLSVGFQTAICVLSAFALVI